MWVSTTLARTRNLWWVAVCTILFGCGSEEVTGPATNNDLFASVTLAAAGGDFTELSSSVPDATGHFVYFLGKNSAGYGVFKVPATGGTPIKITDDGALSQPTDVVIEAISESILVADPGKPNGGVILSINSSGYASHVVLTAGTQPVALDVPSWSLDRVYYCGTVDGQKAVFVASSTDLDTLYKGTPLNSPTGIVIAKDRSIYIADQGTIHRLSEGKITQIATGLTMGSPAGITLTPDEKSVVVSSKSSNGKAQVDIISLTTGERAVFNKVIGANSAPAGLHGARGTQGFTGVYSWVDRVGGIYRLGP